MTELLTAAQMRAIEQAAIASGEVTGLELMERAGRGVVEAVFEEWPELKAGSFRAVVLCGPGNNGGDGFVVARLLQEWGWEVEVFLYGAPEKMPPDARVNYERWLGMGEVIDYESNWEDPPVSGNADLVIDALFGTGLTRPVTTSFYHMWPEGDLRGVPGVGRVVAVDIPSGLCSDSGRGIGDQVTLADLTVTFHQAKLGHFLGEGPSFSGRVRVVDIGLTPRRPWLQKTVRELGAHAVDRGWTLYPPGAVAQNVDPECLLIGRPRYAGKREDAHKYSHGHALILSGPSGRGGAARLAARGALRIGAGVVTVGCPPDAIHENAARLDAVMLRGVAEADDLYQFLEDKRVRAYCLGPGMIENLHSGSAAYDRARSYLSVILRSNYSVVIDAAALTAFTSTWVHFTGKHGPQELFAMLHPNCVLTPHAGEFAGLFPDIAEKLSAPATKGPAYSKVDATREAARRAGCVVLFKGPDTVIAGPDGRCAINSAHYDRAAPWLATAGSGDVLAGFITGLLARGFSPFDAACTGAWLHVECARSFGPGLIAEDLPEELPKVFRAMSL